MTWADEYGKPGLKLLYLLNKPPMGCDVEALTGYEIMRSKEIAIWVLQDIRM